LSRSGREDNFYLLLDKIRVELALFSGNHDLDLLYLICLIGVYFEFIDLLQVFIGDDIHRIEVEIALLAFWIAAFELV
jgi:hypothetical protein